MKNVTTYVVSGCNYVKCPECSKPTKFSVSMVDLSLIRNLTEKSRVTHCNNCGKTFVTNFKVPTRYEDDNFNQSFDSPNL